MKIVNQTPTNDYPLHAERPIYIVPDKSKRNLPSKSRTEELKITAMINLENFNENYKYYGNDVVVQIIDMFIEDHQEDLKMIEQNITNKNFLSLRFSAHHLKGSIANFMDPETTELTRKLEEMGENKTEDALAETFAELQFAASVLLKELLNHRKKIASRETCFS